MHAPEQNVDWQEPPTAHVGQVHRGRQFGEGERRNENIEDHPAQGVPALHIQDTLHACSPGSKLCLQTGCTSSQPLL